MVTVAPRLLDVNGRLYLMSAELSFGHVVSLSGPYTCISDAGVTPQAFLAGVASTLQRASEAAPIQIADLPEELQSKVLAAFIPPPQPASEEST